MKNQQKIQQTAPTSCHRLLGFVFFFPFLLIFWIQQPALVLPLASPCSLLASSPRLLCIPPALSLPPLHHITIYFPMYSPSPTLYTPTCQPHIHIHVAYILKKKTTKTYIIPLLLSSTQILSTSAVILSKMCKHACTS